MIDVAKRLDNIEFVSIDATAHIHCLVSLSYVLYEFPGINEKFLEENVSDSSLFRAIAESGIVVKVLPESTSVVAPSRTV